MKIIFYILAGVIGLLAALALLRGIETLAVGGGVQIFDFLVALVGFALCFIWIKRARGAK